MVAYGIAAIIISYLLGSFPTAYLVARKVLGEDIRKLGGGNVGGLNTYRQVGTIPAAIVAITDISKGAIAVAIAFWAFHLPMAWVLAAALAVLIGHMWMVYLKFSGGKAIGTLVGVLAILFTVNGYWLGMVIWCAIVVVLLVPTRNVALSTGTAILFNPIIIWLGTYSVPFLVWSIVAGLLIAFKYFPVAKEAWNRSAHKKDFIFDRWKRA